MLISSWISNYHLLVPRKSQVAYFHTSNIFQDVSNFFRTWVCHAPRGDNLFWLDNGIWRKSCELDYFYACFQILCIQDPVSCVMTGPDEQDICTKLNKKAADHRGTVAECQVSLKGVNDTLKICTFTTGIKVNLRLKSVKILNCNAILESWSCGSTGHDVSV